MRSRALLMSQRRRLATGSVLGAIVGGAVAVMSPWQLAVLAGWIAAASVILASIWMFVPHLDGEMTRAAANREDLSTANDDFVILAASVISLVGVVLALVEAKHTSGGLKAWLTTIAVLTVVVSWALVHTMFTLRYAHLYYDEPAGGVDFPDEDLPDYLDFVYLALTIGMTFQVSDTNITDRSIRRAVTRHAALGYLFGTVIIGVTINVVGGLIQ
ncbi:MAG: hypothetical protein JWL72_4068 [Ilumatobacteraceae bacterium]|nr:hypothetical protein [Ilumatobacteraceae bacterium]MCU1390730.1 hypothetical protein [Ilumatobacteraceae bacterium]